jgi:hypothetical protein
MSQRNRIAFATIVLTAALFLAAPSPSQAASLGTGRTPAVATWERAWSWLAGLLPGALSQKPAARQEKEGSMINPNGTTGPWITAPVPGMATDDEGSMINPNGHD